MERGVYTAPSFVPKFSLWPNDRPEQCYFEAKQIATIAASLSQSQGCQMAKFDPYLSLDCARVEGVGAQSKERKGSNFAA